MQEVTMLSEFRLYLLSKGLTDRTVQQTLYRLQKFDQPSIDALKTLILKLRSEGRGGSCVNKYIEALKHYYTFKGLEWDKTVTLWKQNRRPRILFTNDEIEEFIGVDPPPSKYGTFWTIAAYTGMRPKEILFLTVDNIDFVRKCIVIETSKTFRGRLIPMHQHLLTVLEEYTKKIDTQYLFVNTSRSGGKDIPLNHASVTKDFKKRVFQVGIKRQVTPYSLRHSFCTRLYEDGVNIVDIGALAGHSKIQTTMGYIHESLRSLHKAIQQDSLVRDMIDPWEVLKRFINMVKVYFERDKRFILSIQEDEETGEIKIRVKVKK